MSPRAAQVRFYVDADILGLGKFLGGFRDNITHPGDPGRHPQAAPGTVSSWRA